ncbi:MAG: condensation domain-containing protein [Dehalococcoidia bacterium]|nr:condensation domain-containing protein [Dehalococcoidia bacterium]
MTKAASLGRIPWQSAAAQAEGGKGPGFVNRLNCFDKCLLAFEIGCTGRRISYSGILYLRGEPDVERLRGAILSAMRAHPELMTTLCGGPLQHHRRVCSDVMGEVLEVQDLVSSHTQQGSTQVDARALYEERIHEWINRRLDVRKDFPFRVLLVKRAPGDCVLVFTFHHSAVDGVRAVRILNDVISRYHNRPPDDCLAPPAVRPDSDELLWEAKAERARTKNFYREMLSHLAYFVLINPLFHPARIFHDKSRRPGEVAFCSARIAPAEFQQLKAKSNSVGGTVNDILMAVCFRSIDRWNRRHGKRTRKISFLVPIDVGSPDLNGIISNQISYISFSTSAKDRTDPAGLLRKISRKRSYMLKERRGNTYSIIYFASVLRLLPLAAIEVFAKYVLFPLYADTVICTNPGIVRLSDCGDEPIEGGNFKVVDFEAVPFVFAGMGMNICVATFNGSLGIYIAYDTGLFSKEKAEEFLALCLDELGNYEVGGDSGSGIRPG